MTYTRAELDEAELRLEQMTRPEQQLSAALQQAEGYRNFVASLTGLLTAVFVLKGQEDLSKLHGCPRWTVISLLAGGFVALIVSSWLTVLAAHGRPGADFYGEPTRLLDYENKRPGEIWRLIEWARWLAVLGILAVAAAVIVTWITPAK
ncbi:hypothetical protein F9278_10415 [Streptomyces phaeolivaceus]|uniref:Uncharacterized protein n=1 Tax=Streptomyces phaeolivaceus TaxID=2653200 RepID=A0A5P8K1R8_9ACTN|nr:hypothetical protein [Streptomyces phaeolivaceus]QFQ96557.1 hypothetical protein F9278_10415 [Streptomyces phaeolivaceus]